MADLATDVLVVGSGAGGAIPAAALAAAGRTATLRVDLSFVLCREGDEAICVPRQVAWEVPVQSHPAAVPVPPVLDDRMASGRQTLGPSKPCRGSAP